MDVTSYAQYTMLAERLRMLGLAEDTSEGAPLCRWRKGTVIIDVMPTDASVLRAYIASEIRSLLDNPDFIEALPGFLLPDAAAEARRSILQERLQALARSATSMTPDERAFQAIA